jgi:hypothetical protein
MGGVTGGGGVIAAERAAGDCETAAARDEVGDVDAVFESRVTKEREWDER